MAITELDKIINDHIVEHTKPAFSLIESIRTMVTNACMKCDVKCSSDSRCSLVVAGIGESSGRNIERNLLLLKLNSGLK